MSVPSRHASRFEKKDYGMPDQNQTVIAGIDCHTDFHVAAALDPLGRVLGTESFPATCAGYRSTHKWLASFRPIAAVGAESTGSCGAALTWSLSERGCAVVEVNQPHRHLRARRGKNDAIEADAAARKVPSGEATAAAKDTTGIVEAIRQLSVARSSAVKARAAALCQLGDLLVTAPAALREQFDGRRTLEGKASVCARLRPDTRLLADPPPRPPKPLCAASAAASPTSAPRPPNSSAASTGWSQSQRPQPFRASAAAAAPTTPRPCSSPPARTSTGSAPKRPSPTCAAPRPSPHRQDAPAATGSTSPTTAKPTAPCT